MLDIFTLAGNEAAVCRAHAARDSLLCVALYAPAVLMAAQNDAARINYVASGAGAGAPFAEVALLPARGTTEVPATAVTPRSRDAKLPAR